MKSAIFVALLTLFIILLAGCTPAAPKVVYQEVKVPVYVRPEPPSELATPYTPDTLPTFRAPGAQGSVVSLDKDGVDSLKEILRTLTTRDEAWRTWSSTDE